MEEVNKGFVAMPVKESSVDGVGGIIDSVSGGVDVGRAGLFAGIA